MMEAHGCNWLRAIYGRKVPKHIWFIQDHEQYLRNEGPVVAAAKQGFTAPPISQSAFLISMWLNGSTLA